MIGERIPVTVITGFLGSGKTTLVNRVLRDPAFANSAVLVNEFGAIGIDHRLVATAKDRVLLLESGCLCCVLTDSLPETLADLYRRRSLRELPLFDRVLIETSGLADPGPILQSLMKDPLISPLFSLAALVCVVDAVNGVTQLSEHVEAREQVALADRLLVSKLDLCDGKPGRALLEALDALNPQCEVNAIADAARSVALQLTSPLHSAAPAATHRSLQPHHHAHHSLDIASFAFELTDSVSWPGIAAWTAHLVARYGDDLLRCKALLRVAGRDGCVVVHGVRRVFNFHHDPNIELLDQRSSIVLIGRQLDRESLSQGLAWLRTTEGERDFVSRDFAPRTNEMIALRAAKP